MDRALYVAVLTLVMIATSGAQQPAITRPDGRNITSAQIDSTVNRLIQAAHVTGAGIALFHDGKVVYLEAYGVRDAEKNLPLTPDSVMTAASLTKSAFATVVMRLVQHGTLNLDKPIEEYLGKPLGDFDPYTDLKGDPRTANGNALETSMDVELTVDVIPNRHIGNPRVETDTDIISMGLDGSLDDAFKKATSDMASWLEEDYKLTPSEIAQVLGTASENHVSEVADRNAGLVLKISKARLATLGK